MGATESKNHQRHRSKKQFRCKNEHNASKKCSHVVNEVLASSKILNPQMHSTSNSSQKNTTLKGNILIYPFPAQRSLSERQIVPSYQNQDEIFRNSLEQLTDETIDRFKGPHDYQKHMKRVDEQHRPVLESLCPEKMYVSTNDLAVCDSQRLPPPLECKMTEGFFRPVPPPQNYFKKSLFNGSYL